MATNGTPPEATAIGTVEAVNQKGTGLKFVGSDGWHNISRFAVGIVLPARGDVVSVTFDKSGFIRAIVPVDGPGATNGVLAPSGAAQRVSAPSGSADRERTIARLAILKAAAEFGASRADLKSGDVLLIAESWERWVLRPSDSLDLDEAF